jgi:cytochrome c551/c552
MAAMANPNVVLALLAGAAALGAQQLPELRTEAVSGGSVFHVRNTAAQPLVSYLIELVDYPGSSYTLFHDDAIAPGAEKSIPVTNMTVGAAPEYVKITAAMYAGGATAGDAAKVALLQGRRKAIADTQRELIARLEKAPSKAAAIAELRQWADSLQPEGKARRMTAATVNQAAARSVLLNELARLERGSLEETLARLRSIAAGRP